MTRSRRELLQWLLLAVPVLILLIGAWRYRNVNDDGYIYLRIVRNVLAGNGPVFNAGERIETYTGPLWLGVLSLFGALRQDALPWVSVLTGIGFSLLAVGIATVSSARLMRTLDPGAFLVPFGQLTFVAVGIVWTFASSGLETGLTFLWLALCFWVLVRWMDDPRLPWWSLVLLGLGPLVRPELTLSSAVFLLPVLWHSWRVARWRGAARDLVWAGLLPVLYQLFRMAYFGLLVPTTAIAKEGSSLRPGWGWTYARDFAAPYWLWVPLLLVLIVYALLLMRQPSRRWMVALLALPAAGLINATFVIAVGGDYMHGRLLLPAFFMVLAPVSALPMTRYLAVGLLVVPWAVVSIGFFRVMPGLRLPVVGVVGGGAVTPEEMGVSTAVPPPWWKGDGVYANIGILRSFEKTDIAPNADYPPTVMMISGIGLSSYVAPLDFYVYDMLGLANPLSAHMELTRRALPGHEKMLPIPWAAAQVSEPGTPGAAFDRPEFVPVENVFGGLIPQSQGADLSAQTDMARRALQCGDLAVLVTRSRSPLTPQRAAQNVLESWRMTRLRVPPDPGRAVEVFCGGAEG